MTGFMAEFATKSNLEIFVTFHDTSMSSYCVTIYLKAVRLQQATNIATTVPDKNTNTF
jgi:hypothetical protein